MKEFRDSPVSEIGYGLRWLMGFAGSSFLIGSIFWAGATYNRVQGIEARLVSIEVALTKIGNIAAMEEKLSDTQRRVDRLETSVQQLR